MKETLWLVRRLALSAAKNYKMTLLFLILPVLGIVLSFLINNTPQGTGLRIGVVNLDASGKVTSDTVQSLRRLTPRDIRNTEAKDAESLLASGELDAVVTFPAGFEDSVKSGNPANVSLTALAGAQVGAPIKSYLDAHLRNLADIGRQAEGDSAKFDRLYESMRNPEFRMSANPVEDRSVQHRMTLQTVGYLLVFMLFSAVNFSSVILKEKENRTYFRLFSSPVTSRAYVSAHVLVNFTMLIVQMAVTILVMTRFFKINLDMPLWQMCLLLSLFSLVAVGMSMAIIAFSRNSMAANGLQTVVIMPTCLIAGCLFPIGVMPEALQQMARFLPQYWLLETVERLQQGTAFSGVLLNLAVLLTFALALAMIAAYKFGRSKELA